jgi:hypothetical protein
MTRLRTAEDVERFKLGLTPVDRAMFESEQRWGVGRLERLVSTNTLLAYQRGWGEYRRVVEDSDIEGLEAIAPKMVAALKFMNDEAQSAGHQPLAPDVWEAPMGDGTVLCVVRSFAEASAVVRAANASDGTAYETTLPPDLAVTVRQQHEGRRLVVVTLAEIARLMQLAEAKVLGTRWEGNDAPSGVQLPEGAAADIVRSGYPLNEALATERAPAVAELDF